MRLALKDCAIGLVIKNSLTHEQGPIIERVSDTHVVVRLEDGRLVDVQGGETRAHGMKWTVRG